MTDQDKKKFKAFLQKEKEELEDKLKKLTEVDFGDDVDSLEEESDEAEELTANIPLSNLFRDRLGNINVALEKLESDRYGICENCGNEIGADLLEIDPESKLCKICKANE